MISNACGPTGVRITGTASTTPHPMTLGASIDTVHPSRSSWSTQKVVAVRRGTRALVSIATARRRRPTSYEAVDRHAVELRAVRVNLVALVEFGFIVESRARSRRRPSSIQSVFSTAASNISWPSHLLCGTSGYTPPELCPSLDGGCSQCAGPNTG